MAANPLVPLSLIPPLNIQQVPTPAQLAGQVANSLNTMLNQALQNPLALLTAPIIVPSALAAQMAPKMQAGVLKSNTVNVATSISGAYIQLQPPGTLIAQGQLYNVGPGSMGVTTDPKGSSAIPVPAGGTFNFGPIDLGVVYIGSLTPAVVQGTLYTEQ